jgi:4-amino-4-deoxy-L-arabinose transferase-like glycosyltransferase
MGGIPLWPRLPGPLLLFLTTTTLFFGGLGAYPLFEPDEGRNAEVAREAVQEGHWLPPTINGEIRYQKPPLYYWVVASSLFLVGTNEFAARLPSALAGLLGVFLTFLLGKRLWGEEEGLTAGIILATSLIYVAYARLVIFDMVFTCFILATLYFFWKGLEDESNIPFFLATLLAALSFLIKGPVGIILILMASVPLLIYRILKRERISLPWILMVLVFVGVILPLFILLELKSPGYCFRFFWNENVLRFFTPRFHREGPIWFYLPVILLGLFPWICLLPKALVKLQGIWQEKREETLFLISWIGLPTLFFTLSQSKHYHYILPTFPAWALLLARSWERDPFSTAIFKVVGALVPLYLCVFFFVLPPWAATRSMAPMTAAFKPSGIPFYSYKVKKPSLSFYLEKEVKVLREERELETVLQGEKRFYLLVRVSDEGKVTSLAKGRSVKKIVLHGKCVLLILGRLPEGGRHAMGTTAKVPVPSQFPLNLRGT